jgi:hypothetical protein
MTDRAKGRNMFTILSTIRSILLYVILELHNDR